MDDPVVPDVIDGDNEVVEEVDVDADAQERAMEDVCHDMAEKQPPRQQGTGLKPDVAVASDVMGISTRSVRRTHKYKYASLGSRGTTRFFQIAKSVVNKIAREGNSKVLPKKLKGEKRNIIETKRYLQKDSGRDDVTNKQRQ